MKHLLSLALFTFFVGCTFSQTAFEQKAIDKIFAAWDNEETPGAALGIIQDGKLTYARGYGEANIEYGIPNDSKSVFRIGSTSKQFTAACIVLLVQQGKLSFEATLDKFYPAFPAYAKNITIRDLLKHTSGIRDYLTLAGLSGLGDDDFYTDATIEKWLSRQHSLNFEPGEEHLYSNSEYWLLGQIVEKASEKNMAEYAEKYIFNPLGMKNTHFHNDHTAIVKNRASGYAPAQSDGYRISMTTLDMIGDGGIFSSIEDLKIWDDAYYSSSVLNADFWAEMTKVGTLNNGKNIDYASGLNIGEYKGLKTVSHGGAFVGFRAEMMRFPDQKTSIIILANRADANPTRMAYGVADIILADQIEAAQKVEMDNPAANGRKDFKAIEMSSKELLKFEGSYWNNQDKMSRILEVRKGKLHYVRQNGSSSPMLPISNDAFYWPDMPMDITVKMSQNEGVKTFVLEIGEDERLEFYAYEPKSSFDDNDFNTYPGRYYSKELDIYYEIKKVNEGLELFINEAPSGQFTPVMDNVLSLSGYMTLDFSTNKNEFVLSAGRVKNLRFEKE